MINGELHVIDFYGNLTVDKEAQWSYNEDNQQMWILQRYFLWNL